MGTKYSTQSISGYNASPPPDDGTTGTDNLVTWAKHKTKIGDPLKTLAENINDALVLWADTSPTAKASAYPTVASDNGRVIEVTGTTTITLGAAATMGAGYEVTVKNAGAATVTVATSDTIDGSASNRTLAVGDSETYVVNNAASAYMLSSNKGVGRTETATLTNKTLTSPVINTGVSGTAILDEDDMSSDSDTQLATQQSIKAYVDNALRLTAGSGGAAERALNSAGLTSVNHGFAALPHLVVAVLECTTIDSNYAVGDQISIGGVAVQSAISPGNGVTAYADSSQVHVAVDANAAITVVNAAGSAMATLTASSWKVSATAYKFA